MTAQRRELAALRREVAALTRQVTAQAKLFVRLRDYLSGKAGAAGIRPKASSPLC